MLTKYCNMCAVGTGNYDEKRVIILKRDFQNFSLIKITSIPNLFIFLFSVMFRTGNG